MSRSLGDLLLTTWPPMRSSPSVMSSSPAIMLRVVDLPQPEGPTRMTNSPSLMSRLILSTASAPSGKRLVTWSKTIAATVSSLTLDRAGCQPGDDPALEEQHEDDDRNGDDHGGGGDGAGRNRELRAAAEVGDRRRRRPGRDRRGERDREQEVVPEGEEDQDRRGDHARGRERGDDLDERLEWRGPVDLGRLLELPGDLTEEGRQRVDAERQAEGDVGDDQPGPGVEQSQPAL